jgi:ATP-dependent helicase HrpB
VFFAKFPGVDRFLKRVEFLNRAQGAAAREQVLIPWEMIIESLVQGKTKLSGIDEAAVLELLEGCLDRDSLLRLENEAPAKLEVPSGNFISVEYDNDPPKLSVRLQEVFGWLETPRIGGGKVPVLMELLSPGFKPIQMTRDLKSFWANAYFEVKKELKARYPKHSWPEDPLSAKAVSYRRKFPPK